LPLTVVVALVGDHHPRQGQMNAPDTGRAYLLRLAFYESGEASLS
jgi:hypothetical protein